MPTVSEPIWPERVERYKQYVQEFIKAQPLSVDDSVDVFSARLFAIGFRGQDLRTEVHLAEAAKFEYRQLGRVVPIPDRLEHSAAILARLLKRKDN